MILLYFVLINEIWNREFVKLCNMGSVRTGDNLIEMWQSVNDEGVNGKWLCEKWIIEERMKTWIIINLNSLLLDKLLGDSRNIKVMGATNTTVAINEKSKIYTLNEALEFAG